MPWPELRAGASPRVLIRFGFGSKSGTAEGEGRTPPAYGVCPFLGLKRITGLEG